MPIESHIVRILTIVFFPVINSPASCFPVPTSSQRSECCKTKLDKWCLLDSLLLSSSDSR